jgi:ATP/ADP translocase
MRLSTKCLFAAATAILLSFYASAGSVLLPTTKQIHAKTKSCERISAPEGVTLEASPSWLTLPDLPEFFRLEGK